MRVHFLLLITNTIHCFPWGDRLTSLIFGKMSTKYPSLNNIILLSFFWVKVMFFEQSGSSACNSSNFTNAFPQDNDHVHPFVIQNVKKMGHENQDFNQINSCCFIEDFLDETLSSFFYLSISLSFFYYSSISLSVYLWWSWRMQWLLHC